MLLLDCFTSRHSCVCEQSLEGVRKDKKRTIILNCLSTLRCAPRCRTLTSMTASFHCCLVYKQKLVATSKNGTVLVCGDIVCFLDKAVVLFTNDSTLCSKALVCNVAVANRKVTFPLIYFS